MHLHNCTRLHISLLTESSGSRQHSEQSDHQKTACCRTLQETEITADGTNTACYRATWQTQAWCGGVSKQNRLLNMTPKQIRTRYVRNHQRGRRKALLQSASSGPDRSRTEQSYKKVRPCCGRVQTKCTCSPPKACGKRPLQRLASDSAQPRRAPLRYH